MSQAPDASGHPQAREYAPRRLARQVSPSALAASVLAVGLTLTALAATLVAQHHETLVRERFSNRATVAFSQVGNRLDDYRNVILGLQSAFIASKEIDRGEFHRYSENLQLSQRFPGLQALSFQRYVRHADKAAFIAAVRGDGRLQPQGYPGFAVRPEGERPEYLVIDYIEPMAENLAAFGYDAATQPAQADAIRQARDTGQFRVSPPFVIAQNPLGAARLVMRAPIYRNGAGTQTVEQRRAALQGFVVLTIDPQTSFSGYFGHLAAEGERIVIEDTGLAAPAASEERRKIFDSHADSRAERSELSRTASREFGGRLWEIQLIAGDAWMSRQPGPAQPWLVFASGLIFSLLLAAMALVQTRAREHALRLAEGMTARLRRGEERLRAAAELSSEWYWEQDAEFRFTDFLGQSHHKAGLDFAQLRGKTRWEVSPAALPPDEWAAHRAALAARQPFTITYRFAAADGVERWLEIKGLARLDDNGTFIGYHGTGRDVTERMRTIAALRKQTGMLQTTLEHMNQGISVIGRDLHLTGHNRRFLELLGFPESLIGADTKFEDFVRYNARRGEYGPGDIEEQVRSRLELARHFLPHHFKRTRPDGTVIDILGTPLPGGGMVTTYTDITTQEQAAEALRAERDFRQRMIDSVPGVFYLLDTAGRFLMWNRNFETTVGYSAERMRNARAPEFFEGEDRELIIERIGSVFERGEATAEARFRIHDGNRRPYLFTGLRVEVDGKPALVGIGIDISERKRAEEALQRQSAVLQTTLEHLEQGISVMDADLHLSAMNRRFCELLDFPEDLIHGGMPFEELLRYNARRGEYGPGDVEQMVRERLELARQLEPHRFKRTRPNGRILEVRGTPIAGGGFVTSYTDITEREHAEAALRLSEQRYRTLIDLSPDAVFVHRKYIILVANAAALKLWGVDSAERVVGRNLLDFIHADSRELVMRRIAALEFDPSLFRLPWAEEDYLRPDGSAVPVEGSATHIELADGAAILSVIRDISARKQAEDALRRLTETLEQRVRERTAELEASNQELESFSYSVSHDLRAPLRALHGFSHLLTEEYGHCLDENALHYLSRIRAASERMGKLIDDLLELARISRQEPQRVEVDLTALAGEIADSLHEQAPRRKVAWRIAEGMRASADPVLMKALLDNLLRNAWKFTAERDEAQIEFGETRNHGARVFHVRDNGAGFEMTYADKLFQPFQRLHDAKRFEGTGIGLAIVQRIVRRHGGSIWAEGQPNEGATFRFTLA